MKNLPARLLLACALPLLAGCRLLTGSEEGNPCPRMTAGSGGCARLVLIVEPPPDLSRAIIPRWDARARPARDVAGVETAVAGQPGPGRVHLTPMRSLTGSVGDTVSLWVSARVIDTYSGGVFAADSVLHVARFAPVGSQAPVDTVRLAPR